jgi:putative endonuclease
MNTKETGNLGEAAAERYLKEKGYKILDKNYVFRIEGSPQMGEIDIIAKRYDTISFIEVKTLQDAGFSKLFSPEDKVDFWKKKKIVRAAEYWLTKNRIPLDSKWQIDTLAVTINPFTQKVSIRHFQNIAV